MGRIPDDIAKVGADAKHGATWLAVKALMILMDCLGTQGREPKWIMTDVRASAKLLAELRPSMPGIRNAVAEALYHLAKLDLNAGLRARAGKIISDLIHEVKTGPDRAAEHAAKLIPRVSTIITLSYSTSVLKTMERLAPSGVRVVVMESRPGYEGRAMAKALASRRIPVILITDAAAAHYLAEADAVVTGADALLDDGSIVNKMGTLGLMTAASAEGIPTYVICETFKFAIRSMIRLEAKDATEVLPPRRQHQPFLHAENIYFDITPSRCISKVITEKGALDDRLLDIIRDQYGKYWRAIVQ